MICLDGGKQPGNRKVELDSLAEGTTKKRKALFEELRARLELSRESCRTYGRGLAGSSGKRHRWAGVFSPSVFWRNENSPCTEWPSFVTYSYCGEVFLH
jgi:hypothetical protein